MTKTKTGTGRRVFPLFVAVLTIITLVFSLSACGQDSKSFRTKNEGESIYSYVAELVSQSEDYKIRFAAAANGYDITPDDATEYTDVEAGATPDYDAAIAEAKDILTLILADTKFKSSAHNAEFEDFLNSLSTDNDAESMSEIIKVTESNNFKTYYELEPETKFPAIVLVWIGQFLGMLTAALGNYYVLALIVFALIVEIVMIPVSIKQQKNMIGMAKLRPAMAKIEKKYAGRNDPQTMQKKREEMMALQQKEGYSPFSGCLPLLLQLIIVGFILYPIIQNPAFYVLKQSEDFSNALLYYATSPIASGGLGLDLSSKGSVIELLSHIDTSSIVGIEKFALIENGAEICERYVDVFSKNPINFTVFNSINLGEIPSFASILILVPLLNIGGQWLTMFLSKKWNQTGMNPAAQDGQTAASMKIMEILPLALTFFILFQIPAMIGVYWFIRSLFSLAKQYLIKLAMPIPQYTAEEIKEMERLEKERQKAQKEALKAQPKFRSLHYIDDEDYEDLPEVKNPTTAKHVSDQAPEIKD